MKEPASGIQKVVYLALDDLAIKVDHGDFGYGDDFDAVAFQTYLDDIADLAY